MERLHHPVEIPVGAKTFGGILARIENPPTYVFEWKGKRYLFECVSTRQISKDWFEEYASKAPICNSCHRLIFPGEPVGIVINKRKKEFVHSTFECSDGVARFSGHIGNGGKLVPIIVDECFP